MSALRLGPLPLKGGRRKAPVGLVNRAVAGWDRRAGLAGFSAPAKGQSAKRSVAGVAALGEAEGKPFQGGPPFMGRDGYDLLNGCPTGKRSAQRRQARSPQGWKPVRGKTRGFSRGSMRRSDSPAP